MITALLTILAVLLVLSLVTMASHAVRGSLCASLWFASGSAGYVIGLLFTVLGAIWEGLTSS